MERRAGMRILWVALAALLLAGPALAQQAPVSIFAGRIKPLGYCQITNLAASTQLVTASCNTGSVPTGASVAAVVVETQAVRWRDDSVAPTATIGMPLAVGSMLVFTETDLTALRFIEQVASAKLSISFY